VASLMPNGRLKVYSGATHTVIVEQAAQLVDDIVAFTRERAEANAA
jgi:hypothetical protein